MKLCANKLKNKSFGVVLRVENGEKVIHHFISSQYLITSDRHQSRELDGGGVLSVGGSYHFCRTLLPLLPHSKLHY